MQTQIPALCTHYHKASRLEDVYEADGGLSDRINSLINMPDPCSGWGRHVAWVSIRRSDV